MCGAGGQSSYLGGVALQGERERFRDSFAGEVVFSGAEAAMMATISSG